MDSREKLTLSVVLAITKNENCLRTWLESFSINGNLEIDLDIHILALKKQVSLRYIRKKYPELSISYYFKKGMSVGEAYNSIFSCLKGDYVYFAHEENVLSCSTLSKLCKKAMNIPVDITFCNYREGSALNDENAHTLMDVASIPEGRFFCAQDVPNKILSLAPKYLGCQIYNKDFILTSKIRFIEGVQDVEIPFSMMAFSVAKGIFFDRQEVLDCTPNTEIDVSKQNYSEIIDIISDIRLFLADNNLLDTLNTSFSSAVLDLLYDKCIHLNEPIRSFLEGFVISTIFHYFEFDKLDLPENRFCKQEAYNWLLDILEKKNISSRLEKLYFGQRDKIIPIVFGAPWKASFGWLSTTISSIKRYASKDYFYDIYVLTTKDDKELRNLLEGETDFNVRISLINIFSLLPKDVDQKLMENDLFYALFAPELLPGYDRICFLKNSVALKDISDILKVNLKNNYIAGATSYIPSIAHIENELDLIYETYIDTNVLIFNADAWRRDGLTEKCVDLLKEQKKLKLSVQDCINLICRDNILILPPVWNAQYKLFLHDTKIDNYPHDLPNVFIFNYMNEEVWFNPQKYLAAIWWQNARQSPFYELLLQDCIIHSQGFSGKARECEARKVDDKQDHKSVAKKEEGGFPVREERKSSSSFLKSVRANQQNLYPLMVEYIKTAGHFMVSFGKRRDYYRQRLSEIAEVLSIKMKRAGK